MQAGTFARVLASPADMTGVLVQAQQDCATIASALRQLLGLLDSAESSEEQQLLTIVVRASDAAAVHRARVEEASQLEQRARALQSATVTARTQVTNERFAQLRPLVADRI